MGGIGSGMGIRPNRKRTKEFVEAFSCIDASSFPFSSMRLFPEKVSMCLIEDVIFQIFKDKLIVSQTNASNHWSYEIPFSLTPAYYGNFRYWFKCPKCNQRRRKLSLIKVDDNFPLFLCRKCWNLVYQSQNLTQLDRLIHKKQHLLQSLTHNSEYLPGITKPKGMHWNTFNQIGSQIQDIDNKITMNISNRFL